jgi:hypothetical protein
LEKILAAKWDQDIPGEGYYRTAPLHVAETLQRALHKKKSQKTVVSSRFSRTPIC